jgi:hypothetical protein
LVVTAARGNLRPLPNDTARTSTIIVTLIMSTMMTDGGHFLDYKVMIYFGTKVTKEKNHLRAYTQTTFACMTVVDRRARICSGLGPRSGAT